MGPFKCPDCGIWWAGLEHRCQLDLMRIRVSTVPVSTGTVTIRCTCPPNRGDLYAGNCLIHDVQVTYT